MLAAFSSTSCGDAHPHVRTKLTPKEFAYLLAEIELAQPAQRAVILKKRHATEADLRDFVKKYAAADPQTLSAAFDTAQARVAQPPK
jgi:hypothetical protein